MSEESIERCSNPDCQVSDTGKCVEGFETLADCPHYGRAPPTGDDVKGARVETQAEPGVPLPAGDALNVDDAGDVLRAFVGVVIAMVGPNDSGKTTLIASFYDLLHRGPVDGYSFAGSRTIPAFERRCHLARAASRRTTPDTERTSTAEGPNFLHLALSTPQDKRIDLLLSDRRGEVYKLAADSHESSKELYEVHRADFVVLLVDGRRLLDSTQRHAVSAECKMILQSFVDAGSAGSEHRIAVTLTKYDLIVGHKLKERAKSDFAELVSWMQTRFSERVADITSFVVSARPQSEIVEPGFGLGNMLRYLARSPAIRTISGSEPPVLIRTFHTLRANDRIRTIK